jgi:hypothetical protein
MWCFLQLKFVIVAFIHKSQISVAGKPSSNHGD